MVVLVCLRYAGGAEEEDGDVGVGAAGDSRMYQIIPD